MRSYSPFCCCCALLPVVCGLLLAGDWLPCCSYRYEQEILNCSVPEILLQQEPNASELSRVHVAYSSDARNFAGVLASMLSLAEHLQDPSSCTIHLIVAKMDVEKASRLVDCFREERGLWPAVEIRTLAEVDISGLSTQYRRHLMKQQTFARVYLHDYLPPDVHRVLWLDHDTIVRSDVRQLYQMRMRHSIAAAWEQGNGNTRDGSLVRVYEQLLKPEVRRMIPDLNARLFSTGILLMDLKQWRAGNTSEEVMRWVRLLEGVEGEQLAMNLHFRGDVDILDWSWNVIGLGWIRYRLPQHCAEKARILHWSGPNRKKPWSRHWSRPTVHDDFFLPYDRRDKCTALH